MESCTSLDLRPSCTQTNNTIKQKYCDPSFPLPPCTSPSHPPPRPTPKHKSTSVWELDITYKIKSGHNELSCLSCSANCAVQKHFTASCPDVGGKVTGLELGGHYKFGEIFPMKQEFDSWSPHFVVGGRLSCGVRGCLTSVWHECGCSSSDRGGGFLRLPFIVWNLPPRTHSRRGRHHPPPQDHPHPRSGVLLPSLV